MLYAVCRDARNMAQEVMQTFYRICREVGGKSETEAVEYMKKMEQTKRYQADVWS
jgi:NADPH-ferrihemoprotein reductase